MDDQPHAAPLLQIYVGDGSNYGTLVERSNDYQADHRMVLHQAQDLQSNLCEQLHPNIWKLVDEVLEKRSSEADAYMDMLQAEMVRHLPGLAPALMLVWEHVRGNLPANVGHCCAGNGSFEPGHAPEDDDGQ